MKRTWKYSQIFKGSENIYFPNPYRKKLHKDVLLNWKMVLFFNFLEPLQWKCCDVYTFPIQLLIFTLSLSMAIETIYHYVLLEHVFYLIFKTLLFVFSLSSLVAIPYFPGFSSYLQLLSYHSIRGHGDDLTMSFFFFDHAHIMQKFLGNAGSLACWATRGVLPFHILNTISK